MLQLGKYANFASTRDHDLSIFLRYSTQHTPSESDKPDQGPLNSLFRHSSEAYSIPSVSRQLRRTNDTMPSTAGSYI